jgi:hypothetical protein
MIDIVNQVNTTHRALGEMPVASGAGRSLLLQRIYDATVEDVWDACTDPERLSRWLGPVGGDFRLGGSFQLKDNASGEILRCEPPQLLKVTWALGDGERDQDGGQHHDDVHPGGAVGRAGGERRGRVRVVPPGLPQRPADHDRERPARHDGRGAQTLRVGPHRIAPGQQQQPGDHRQHQLAPVHRRHDRDDQQGEGHLQGQPPPTGQPVGEQQQEQREREAVERGEACAGQPGRGAGEQGQRAEAEQGGQHPPAPSLHEHIITPDRQNDRYDIRYLGALD